METTTYKLVYEGNEVVIFEGGTWVKTSDWKKYHLARKTGPPIMGLHRNEKTGQITIYYLPNFNP